MNDEDPNNASDRAAGTNIEHHLPKGAAVYVADMKIDSVEMRKVLAEAHEARLQAAKNQTIVATYVLFKAALAAAGDQATPTVGFLDWVLKPSDAEDARANLDEVMPMWIDRHGMKVATWLYKWQAGRIAVRYVYDRLLGQAERLIQLVRPGL